MEYKQTNILLVARHAGVDPEQEFYLLAKLADKALLPKHIVLETVDETIERFHLSWNDENTSRFKENIRDDINTHLKTLALLHLPSLGS